MHCYLNVLISGTNGGISPVGTLASAVGGLLVGIAYFIPLLMLTSTEMLRAAPPQWLIIPTAMLAGLLGSMIDSVLGAWFQYSGMYCAHSHELRGGLATCTVAWFQ